MVSSLKAGSFTSPASSPQSKLHGILGNDFVICMPVLPHPGESQIEEAGNSGLGFGEGAEHALRWGGSEGRQLDTCILRVSFSLLAGNVTHVRQVSEGHVRTTELCWRQMNQKKKKNWGKLLTLGGTERELSDTAGQCPPPWRVWVYVSV